MSQDQQTIKLTKTLFMIFASLFSFIAMIMVFVSDFGGWWLGGGYSNYYYWIGSEIAPAWSQIFIVLLGLLFLILTGVSVYMTVMILREKENNLTKMFVHVGLIGGGLAFIFTLLVLGILMIIAGDWEVLWLSTGFYGGLIGSILIGIFYLLYFVLNKRNWSNETPAK